jgi:hypothetical protein
MSIRLQKFNNEVNADCIPSGVGCWEWFEVVGWESSLDFGVDAEITGGSVLTNVPRHLWPPIIPAHQLQSLPSSGVSSNLTIMIQSYNLPTDICGWGNIDFSAEVQDTVFFRPL